MTSGRTECALAVLAAFCVLVAFLFPALQGPYPAVHGPVTALLSLRAAARLRLVTMRNSLRAVSARVARARAIVPALRRAELFVLDDEPASSSAALSSILRC
ncbi:MAG: hypothetical protein ACM3WP_19510 [Acidobacteriota bacterium]